MSNVISSGFAVVSKARVAWDGTASFGSPCAAVLSGCQGFSSIFLPGRGLWPSLPAGQLSTASCARRRPYDEPRYRAYVLHMRLLIRGPSDHKPGCDSGDTQTPKGHSDGRARSGTSAGWSSGAGTSR